MQMRKILGAIFGSSKNTETVLSGIDKAFFTKEEKSDYFLKYLAATQPQNLARRFIAMSVVLLWSLLILVGIVAHFIAEVHGEFVFGILAEVVATPFSIIIGFYFAAHLARAWKKDSK